MLVKLIEKRNENLFSGSRLTVTKNVEYSHLIAAFSLRNKRNFQWGTDAFDFNNISQKCLPDIKYRR